MTHASASVLKTLLENKPHLLRYLPESEIMEIDNASFLMLDCKEDCLEDIHWSWLTTALKNYKVKEKKLFINAAPTELQEAMSKAFKINTFKESVSPIGQHFLSTWMMETIKENQKILPKEAFQKLSLYKLLLIPKKKLIETIDFLSFYDLSATLLSIVNTKVLKLIHSFFSTDELEMIRKISHHKSLYLVRPMNLKNWDESEEEFRLLLHKRGLTRFAIALSLEPSDFVWHVCHKLDIGRGKWLLAQTHRKLNADITQEIKKQLEELLVRL